MNWREALATFVETVTFGVIKFNPVLVCPNCHRALNKDPDASVVDRTQYFITVECTCGVASRWEIFLHRATLVGTDQ
jgi:hypothetical protein